MSSFILISHLLSSSTTRSEQTDQELNIYFLKKDQKIFLSHPWYAGQGRLAVPEMSDEWGQTGGLSVVSPGPGSRQHHQHAAQRQKT